MNWFEMLTSWHVLQTSPKHAGHGLSHAPGRIVFKAFGRDACDYWRDTESWAGQRPTCWQTDVRLTFAAAAAASQTPPDDQADGVSCGRGLALLCCRGNRGLGRWRKWTSILRWEAVTTEVAVSEFRSCLATMTKRSPADLKGAKYIL